MEPNCQRVFILINKSVTPITKCRLRMLKLDRVKDYLLMEQEFIENQERVKPTQAKVEEEESVIKRV